MSYREIDLVLAHLDAGFDDDAIASLGVARASIDAVRARVVASHHKRAPTVVPAVQPTENDVTLFLPRTG